MNYKGLLKQLLFSLLGVLALMGFKAVASDNVLHIALKDIMSFEGVSKLDPQVKYQLGDNPEWANPEFDDSNWPLMRDTRLMENSEVSKQWNGIGWFRLKFQADSSLLNRPLFLTTRQSCAMEIYIDGRLWTQIGKVSPDKEGEECRVQWEIAKPNSVVYTDSEIHTLAIRYSHHPSWMNSRDDIPIGFVLSLIDQEMFLIDQDKKIKKQAINRWFFTGVPLTFTLIHFLLFFYNRKLRSNLHYAIFTFACAGLTFFVMGTTINVPLLLSHIYFIGFKLSLILIFISVLRFQYGLFYPNLPPQYKIFLGVGIFFALFSWYLSTFELYVFGLIIIIESTRVSIQARFKQIEGFRIISVGYSIFGVLCAIQMLCGVGVLPLGIFGMDYPYLYGILGLLICMSVYLAREFTETQHKLSLLSETQEETIRKLEKEMEVRKQAEELNTRQQKELIQADKMSTLGILVSGVAHEINNPNNYMLLNSNNLTDIWKDLQPLLDKYYKEKGDFNVSGLPYSEIREEIAPLISSITDGSERIRKIVDSLKNFSRKDPGSLNEKVRIYDVLDASVTILTNLIKKSTHHFNWDCPEDLPYIKGNFQQLEQVVINLISNACQALESKEAKIDIRVYSKAEKVIIEIKDTGKGISPEDLTHIMDPFFTTKRDSGGTGLGLSITYSIVKDHGGDLNYESKPGKGTSVILTLPVMNMAE